MISAYVNVYTTIDAICLASIYLSYIHENIIKTYTILSCYIAMYISYNLISLFSSGTHAAL